jgi:hypothetical protein
MVIPTRCLIQDGAYGTWSELAIEALGYSALGYFIAEFQAYALRSTAHVRSFTWLLLVPILAWPIFGILEIVLVVVIAAIFDLPDIFQQLSDSQVLAAFHIVVLIIAAIILAYSKRKPPVGFRGTYEA